MKTGSPSTWSSVSGAGDGPVACVALIEDVILRKTASIQAASSDEHKENKSVKLSRKERKACDPSSNENATVSSLVQLMSLIGPRIKIRGRGIAHIFTSVAFP